MINSFYTFCAKRRWIKRLIGPYLPKSAWVKIHPDLVCYFDPSDLRGPSHHVAFQPFRGFYNYEEVDRDEIVRLLPPNGTFIDIGANIGLFSLYIAEKRPDASIVAYEPESVAHDCFQKSIERNQFKQIQLFKMAIAESSGEANLYLSDINAGGHSFHLDSQDKTTDHFEKVTMGPLQAPLTGATEDRIDFIKIDVEGFEVSALKGCLDVIKKFRPVLMVECHNEEIANKSEIYSFFAKNFRDQLHVRSPGSADPLTLEMWSDTARERFEVKRRQLDNYVFEFVSV